MRIDSQLIQNLIIFTAAITASWIGGIIVRRWFEWSLHKFAKKTSWKWDDIVIEALSKIIIQWAVLLGLLTTNHFLDLPSAVKISLDKILHVLVIATVTWAISRICSELIRVYLGGIQEEPHSTSLLVSFSRWIIIIVGALMILQTLNISITPVLTTLGVGGLAVALALQGTLANLFSGILIIATKQINPGDFVKLDTGDEGYVTDITWRNTSIRTFSNNTVLIPNSKLADAVITNYYLPHKEIAVRVSVGVSYDSDLDKVEEVTKEVAVETMRDIAHITSFEPLIRFHTFNDFSIDFTVIMRAGEVINLYLVQHEFIKRLHKRYAMEKIEIPFPIRTLHMKGTDRQG
ncbi:MAG: mechanosensitive ion channel family protein [Deltaproteobacteria bacterium]|nr:mechanosensitive ion channel family protein [Deltaproteobacteria bacterium]